MKAAAIAILAMSCAPEVSLDVDLKYAEGRAARQTDPRQITILETDLPEPYYVLADLEVTVRQRSSFGDGPTRALAIHALREQAARIGAHAVVLTAFGEEGMSLWSYHELKGHGRAVRFR
jgi:hypothetical protein